MPTRFGVEITPWTFATDGGAALDAALDASSDHVVIPAVTGPLTRFRLQPDATLPLFLTDGGWHYPPNAKVYGAAGVRPAKARWFGTADQLRKLCDAATRLGLACELLVDLRRVPALAATSPQLLVHNAWGQPVPHAGLCGIQPHVRALLESVFAELRDYTPARVILADWQIDAPPTAADVYAELGAAAPLLDICFCTTCRALARRLGIDGDRVAELVRTHVAGLQADRVPSPLEDAELDEYCQIRHADWAADIARLAGVAPAPLCLLETPGTPPLDAAPEGCTLMRAVSNRAAADDAVAALHATCDAASEVWLPAWRPLFPDASTLVRGVRELHKAGVSRFVFGGVEAAPPDVFNWLRQAQRYVRRESTLA